MFKLFFMLNKKVLNENKISMVVNCDLGFLSLKLIKLFKWYNLMKY